MQWIASLLAHIPVLQLPNAAPVDALCAAVGEQAASLLPNDALYVYWGEPGEPSLELRFALHAACTPVPFPDYAGWLREDSYTPVPLSLPRTEAARVPRPYSQANERWLDLPVGSRLLLRFRLSPEFPLTHSHRHRLVRWSQAGAAALARVLPS